MKSGRFLWISGFGLLTLLAVRHWEPARAIEVKSASENADLLRFEVKAAAEDTATPANGEIPKVRRGQVVKVIITGAPKSGYHTYPVTKRTSSQYPAQLSRLTFGKVPGVTPLWPISETEPEKHLEEKVGTLFEHFKPFTWAQDVLVTAEASTGKIVVPIKLRVQACNDKNCVWVDYEAKVPIEVTGEEPVPMSPALSLRLATPKPPIDVVAVPGEEPKEDILKSPAKKTAPAADKTVSAPTPTLAEESLIKDTQEQYKAKIEAIAKQLVPLPKENGDFHLLQFILAGIFWGAISLVTPCVFPMIPITVSFFLKQSEKEHHRPLMMATVYSLTIVIVLTLAAAFLLSIFRWLSVHPITNCFLGGLFVFFALSLFGMYEIELPSSLAQFTSAREGKGGLVGTFFMALTFTIISFACVAPFLGGFSGTAAAERPIWHNLLGGLAFSVTFASPFFFLALFPVLLRRMPKSGSWLNAVKVVMGFMELAAAFKFFRSAELVSTSGNPSFFTFDLVLGIWIALCVLSSLYLLGIFRLPHDSPVEHIGVARLLFSAAFLGLSLYLAPALFKVNAAGQSQRPAGGVYAWIDSFLLPDFQQGENEIPHTADLNYAVSSARQERQQTKKAKRIFIDFTGISCTNCNINERNVFSRPAIAKLFEPYIVVKLYTDTVPAYYYAPETLAALSSDSARLERLEADAKSVNLPLQRDYFGGEQLPLYVILEPDLDNHIRVVAMYKEGLINNVAAFANFLKNPDKYQQGQ